MPCQILRHSPEKCFDMASKRNLCRVGAKAMLQRQVPTPLESVCHASFSHAGQNLLECFRTGRFSARAMRRPLTLPVRVRKLLVICHCGGLGSLPESRRLGSLPESLRELLEHKAGASDLHHFHPASGNHREIKFIGVSPRTSDSTLLNANGSHDGPQSWCLQQEPSIQTLLNAMLAEMKFRTTREI